MPVRALLFGVLSLATAAAAATEISVLSAGAVKAPLESLSEMYQRQTGDKISAVFATVGSLQEKIASGQRADVVIATAAAIDDLERRGKVVAGSTVPLGQVGV